LAKVQEADESLIPDYPARPSFCLNKAMRRIPIKAISIGLWLLILAACTHQGLRQPSSVPVYESDFISAPDSFPSLHGATLTEIPSLELILGCWYAGSREMGTDVQIYCSRSQPNMKEWSSPIVAVAAQEKHTGDYLKSKSIGNPVVYHDPETKLTYLFFGTVTVGGWRGVRTFYRISKDFGQTWSASIMVDGSFSEDSVILGRVGKFVRIKPILISKDELLLPMYSEWDEKRSFSCLFKKGNGIFKEDRCQVMPGKNSLQPSLVLFQQDLRAYTRSKNGFIQTSHWDRNTLKWSPLENLSVPNPDSSIDSVSTFDESKLLLVGNALSSGRHSMDLLVSADGKSFKKIFSFDQSDDPMAEFSYPAIVKSSDGFYHLAYTHMRRGIKHIRFNDAWLQSTIANGK